MASASPAACTSAGRCDAAARMPAPAWFSVGSASARSAATSSRLVSAGSVSATISPAAPRAPDAVPESTSAARDDASRSTGVSDAAARNSCRVAWVAVSTGRASARASPSSTTGMPRRASPIARFTARAAWVWGRGGVWFMVGHRSDCGGRKQEGGTDAVLFWKTGALGSSFLAFGGGTQPFWPRPGACSKGKRNRQGRQVKARPPRELSTPSKSGRIREAKIRPEPRLPSLLCGSSNACRVKSRQQKIPRNRRGLNPGHTTSWCPCTFLAPLVISLAPLPARGSQQPTYVPPKSP